MYNEYEESFYYDQPESSNTEIASASFALAGGLLGTVISVVMFVISRYDVLSSGLLALLVYLLTYKNGWTTAVYVIGAIGIFIISMLLQHISKIARVVYTIFVCVVVSILGPIVIGYESDAELYKIMTICFAASVVWGFISWNGFVSRK